MFERKRSAASPDSIRVLALPASYSDLPNARNDLIAEFKSATRLSFGKVSKSPVSACLSYVVTSSISSQMASGICSIDFMSRATQNLHKDSANESRNVRL